jgi:hypothetical protein
MEGGGISLQINRIACKIVLEQFLVEAQVKAVGNLDNTINNEKNIYLTVFEAVATPWAETSPLKPLTYAQGIIKIDDILFIYPTDPAEQAKITLMPHKELGIAYSSGFAIQSQVFMGADANLTTVLDAAIKRFLIVKDVSIFPLFAAKTSISQEIPLGLLNKQKVYQIHAAG